MKNIPDRPILYGDGINDDAEALQAMVDGRSVFRPDGTLIDPSSYIREKSMKRIKTFVFGMILVWLLTIPAAFILEHFQVRVSTSFVVGVLLGILGMAIAIKIDAKPPERPQGG